MTSRNPDEGDQGLDGAAACDGERTRGGKGWEFGESMIGSGMLVVIGVTSGSGEAKVEVVVRDRVWLEDRVFL